MPCFHPLQAWRVQSGDVVISNKPLDGANLQLPCGNCLGCRTQRAQAWALRCQLELQNHHTATFVTLTYDDAHLPLTLDKRHVSAYLKKLRKTIPAKLRFFASGEYGEHTNRPHYHAILYGVSQLHSPQCEEAWGKGHVRVDPATPASIAYVAGYCSKKIGYRRFTHERVDPTTGEVYQWQPPFIQMSRNPGIAASFRADKYLNNWRLYAVKDGHKMPVPRYLKKAWLSVATPEDTDKLATELEQLNRQAPSKAQLRAMEKIAEAEQRQRADKRNLE